MNGAKTKSKIKLENKSIYKKRQFSFYHIKDEKLIKLMPPKDRLRKLRFLKRKK